jgi:peptidyl-tRNA hydrolase
MSQIEFVLGAFTPEERPLIGDALVTAQNAVAAVVEHDLDWAMNHYN